MKNISMRILFAFMLAVVMLVTVAVATTEYPPVEIRFDGDADAVALKSYGASNAKTTEENGVLKIVGTAGGNDNVTFTLAEEDRFDLYLYPYFKVKFKSTSTSHYSQLYVLANDADAPTTYTHRFYTDINHSVPSSNRWQAPVRTLGTTATSSLKGLSGHALPSGAGDNIVSAFRFDVCRNSTVATTAEIEYIAFFHTEEEALAYGNTCNEYVDAVSDTTYAYDNAGISTKADLVAAIQADINAMEAPLNLGYDATATVEISDETYNALMENGSGVFNFDVTFSTYKSVDRKITLSAVLVDSSVKGSVTASSSSSNVEYGGAEFTLTANLENIIGVTAFKWYSSTDNVIDENDTLVANVTTLSTTVKSPATASEVYYYVVLETLYGGYTSEAIKVTFVKPATIIWDMSTQTEVDKWAAGVGVTKNAKSEIPVVTDPNGVSYAHVLWNGEGVVNYSYGASSANVDNRPYMVLRLRRNFTADLFHYISTTYLDENVDLQYAWYAGMLVPSSNAVYPGDGQWHTVIRHMPTDLKGYTSSLKGNNGTLVGEYEWRSAVRGMMLQPSVTTKGYYADHEFIAFAATEEDAYKVGADYAAKYVAKKTDISEALFENGTANAELTKIIKEYADIYGYTVSDVSAEVVTEPTEAADGAYTFTYKLSANGYTYTYEQTALLKGVGTDKPIIWRFNNEDAVADWNKGKHYNSTNVSVLKDGVMYTAVAKDATVDDIYLSAKGVGGAIPANLQFQRQLYPYFKIKYRQGGHMSRGTLYLDNATTYIALPSVPAKDEWTTVAFDFSTVKLNSGEFGTGPMKALGIWLWNNKTADSYNEIEYVAFFPSGEAGKAAWENFDSKNPTVKGSSDEYIEGYAEIDGVVEAVKAQFDPASNKYFSEITDAAGAKALVEAAIAETDDEVTYVVSDGVEVDYGYKFNVELSCGIDYKACFTKEIELVVKTKPAPIIYRFNTEEAIADWNRGRNFNSPNTSSLENGTMHTPIKADALVSDHYLGTINVNDKMPEGLSFKYEEYPYFKAKYRHDGGAKHGQIYFNGASNRYDFTIASNTAWATISADFTTATMAAGAYPTGDAQNLAIWLWNDAAIDGFDELEYIAFFPAGEEGKAAWQAFDSATPNVSGSSDAYIDGYDGVNAVVTALNEDYGFEAYPEVADIAEARAMVEETITTALEGYDVDYTLSAGDEASNGFDFVVALSAGDNYKAKQNKTVVVTVMTKGGKQPLIWRFNNATAVADWEVGKEFNKDEELKAVNGSIVDGVLRTPIKFIGTVGTVNNIGLVNDHYLGTSAVGGTMPADLAFNYADYPYLKIKYRHDGATSKIQCYLNGGGNYFEVTSLPAANTWGTIAIDLSTVKYGGGSFPATTATSFGFWSWNSGKKTGYDEIEYIAFFPKGNAGKKAWEKFDSANPTVTGSSDAYLSGYEYVGPVEEALKTAFANVNEAITTAEQAKNAVIDTVVAAVGTSPVTYTVAEPVANDEGYTVSVTFNAGENAKACVVRTVDVKVKNKYPAPVVWRFNNPDFVSLWEGGGNCSVTFGDDADGAYLSAAMLQPIDNCNITWKNIPEENRFNATEYPYFAIRYKSSRAGNMQFYPATSLSSNTSASGSFYYQFAMPAHTGNWQTKVWNVKTDCNSKNNGAGTWDGDLEYLRIDFMRSAEEMKWIKIDYIAFFATKEQADAYIAAPYVYGDKEIVDALAGDVDYSALEALDINVVDTDTATAKLDAFIDSLSISEGTVCTKAILGYDAGDAEQADGKIGSYSVKLYFINGPLGASAVASKTISMPLAPKAVLKALGAQLRNPGADQGLRFGASLAKNIFADPDVTNVSYGTVILPEDAMPEGEMLTLDTVATTPGIKVADVKADVIYSETDSTLVYTAVITGISPEDDEACARRFVTRPYVKYTFNGEEFTVYADSEKTRSVDDVEGLTMEGFDTAVPVGKVPYDRETWMIPFWKGNVVYHELFWPVMPDGAAETDDLEVTLLYPITDVLSLKDGTNTVDFVENKDFFVRDGKLIIPATSAIRRTAFNYYIADNNEDGFHGQTVGVGEYAGKKLFFQEGTYIQQNFQYSISYLHSETWPETALNPTKDYDATTLTATRAKLANKEKLLVGFFGDSITAGGNNTGNYGTHPNTPKWSQMIIDSLKALYEYDDISLVNKAVGGKTSVWGRNGDNNSHPNGFAKDQFKDNIPDLFVLAFGMNDESTGVVNFKANIINIIDQIRELNPNCEFILVSNSMPNPLWGSTANRTQYETISEEIVTELRARTEAEGGPVVIDCAKLQGMHKKFLEIKPYRDMSGNNVNHQNDMLARLYAQTVLSYITNLYK